MCISPERGHREGMHVLKGAQLVLTPGQHF